MPFANDCIQLANIPMALIESFEIGQNVETTIRIIIKDSKGRPIDLTKWGIPERHGSSEPSNQSSSSGDDHHHHHDDDHHDDDEHHDDRHDDNRHDDRHNDDHHHDDDHHDDEHHHDDGRHDNDHHDDHDHEHDHHGEPPPRGAPYDSLPAAAPDGTLFMLPKCGEDRHHNDDHHQHNDHHHHHHRHTVPIPPLGAPDSGPLPPYDGTGYYYYHGLGAPPSLLPIRPPPCRMWHDHHHEKHGVEIVSKEMPNSSMILFKKMAHVRSEEEARHGIVHLDIDRRESGKPGSFCTMAIVWEHGTRRFNMPFYFVITPAYDEFVPSGGPITIAEIRLWMRDKEPSDNFLLDSVEFHDSEIVAAIRSPIDYWNEVPPPLQEVTYSNFPFRFHWIEASTGLLLRMAALWMRRNDLDYSAAGVSVQDTKKWPDYLKMYEERWGRYEQWVRAKKMEINISQSYVTLGGFYTSAWGTH